MISKSCADKAVVRLREENLCASLLLVTLFGESLSVFACWLSSTDLQSCPRAQIHTQPSIHTRPYVHKLHGSVSGMSHSERLGTASSPRDR